MSDIPNDATNCETFRDWQTRTDTTCFYKPGENGKAMFYTDAGWQESLVLVNSDLENMRALQ